MKIAHTETLCSIGPLAKSKEWKTIKSEIEEGIASVVWPEGSSIFTIKPESGKKRGEGNGVKPIKDNLVNHLVNEGWEIEKPLDLATLRKPGKIDAVRSTKFGDVALEWETGNISSSHRALNKMAIGMLKGKLAAGILIVPSRELYPYLTDRIGNWAELTPYLDLWKSIPIEEGVLEIIVIEHDATSDEVPRIPKGTDGRAKS